MESIRCITGAAARHAHHHRCSHYGIRHWALFLTSIPKAHQQRAADQPRRLYATKNTTHERATRKLNLAPRVAYQPTSATTWIISDGLVSADKEAIALAKGLSLPWTVKRVQWRQGLQWLPIPFKKLIMDYHHVMNRRQTDKLPWFLTGDPLAAPYPSFVLGSGTNAVPGLLQVSRMSGKASYSAHIHFPALPFIHFDQVFLQRHEVVVQLAALGLMKDQKNYFRINSTLNTITPKSLVLARTKALDQGLIPKSYFSDRNSSSIVAVLIGGPNEDCSHNTDRMVNRLARLIDVQGCRVLISFSQRTAANTKQAIAQLRERVQDDEKIFVYDPMAPHGTGTTSGGNEGNRGAVSWTGVPGPIGAAGFLERVNPYEAMLALADKIVVTADSVAMTNEALATGKPVYVLGGELARGKLKVFHRYLADSHATRAFRPGRIPIMPLTSNSKNGNGTSYGNDTADPLSYPGDHPAWNTSLAGQGPDEIKKLAERLRIMRESRITGRRVPEHIAEATC
ncbi:mitochondrial fission ELM1-domain-containing protein [Gamsiella multidivaricata]|uniref:mitochondrial fission ELM1-domain-containing protein n=1 Tax=Gamsiella multidivaricata TaxID=101098 RepID=UPI00221FF463|nr:mitochondrial fission ELM1-domain-containing protein [Gamsiella multidivaricata]KAG0370203.1 hypothetical protein BGZ54_007312 [Gamsiella multidivaricata]KAI7832582.1 mitochondrial fission ELM1-domain-containing protein [Gamsiella multidivaricata]